MKQKVIISGTLYPATNKAFEEGYRTYLLKDIKKGKIPATDVEDCEVFVSNSLIGASKETLEQFPGLKLVANFGTGVDKIDLEYCAQKKIAVTHTPGVLTEDVADLTIGLIIATLRQIATADRFVRNGLWPKEQFPLAHSLRKKKVGIVGLGQIGREIARLCEAFDTEIGYYGPNKKEVAYRYFETPETLSQWSEVLVAACPGGAATNGIISKEVLANLGENGIFINIARGSVVDEEALVQALVQGRIGGAGLDVFANEPKVPQELFQLDNVVMQPHLGSATDYTRNKMGELCLANVEAYFAGKPLVTEVVK